MASKFFAAGIGRKHLHLSRLQVSVVGGRLTRCLVNPAEYETAVTVPGSGTRGKEDADTDTEAVPGPVADAESDSPKEGMPSKRKRKHLLLSRFQVSVVGGGLARYHGEVFVNPTDYETAVRVFRPSVLDRALEASGEALLLGSAVSSSFQGVSLLGLFAGRGLGGSASELLERAFPEVPSRPHYTTLRVKMTVLRCRLLATQLEARLRPGSDPGSSGGPGSGTRGDADVDTDTEAVPGSVGDAEVPSVPLVRGRFLGVFLRAFYEFFGF